MNFFPGANRRSLSGPLPTGPAIIAYPFVERHFHRFPFLYTVVTDASLYGPLPGRKAPTAYPGMCLQMPSQAGAVIAAREAPNLEELHKFTR